MKKIIIDDNYIADANEICQIKYNGSTFGLIINYKNSENNLFKNVKKEIIDDIYEFLKDNNTKTEFDVREYRIGEFNG